MALDIGVPLDAGLFAFGSPATVTRPSPNDTPVSTTAILDDEIEEESPFGSDHAKRDPRRVIGLPRIAALPEVEPGTRIVMAEIRGGPLKTWQVEQYEGPAEPDAWWVIVREIRA